MIGNDVVDLVLARKESNWKRKGFLDKIFTRKEQLQIKQAVNQEEMVWILWSRKESAYKIYHRKSGIRAYIPLQLECFDLFAIGAGIIGKVVINDLVFFTKTEITEDFIHTIAVEKIEDFDSVIYLKNLNNIIKNNNIPNYFQNKKSDLKPASISHHGRFTEIVSINSAPILI